MPEYKDYYKIMGVARDVGQDELKRVYRRLARKYHPDVSKEKDAEARFKEVQEAYEVLKDPEKRAAYDQLGSNWRQGQDFRPPPDWGQNFEFSDSAFGDQEGGFSDFFSSLFGAGGVGGRAGRSARWRSRFRDGGRRSSRDHRDRPRRFVSRRRADHRAQEPADGRRRRVTMQPRTLKITIPKASSKVSAFVSPARAVPVMAAARRAICISKMHFRKHRLFQVDGRDVTLTLPIAPWEAALGATVPTPTLGGPGGLAHSRECESGTTHAPERSRSAGRDAGRSVRRVEDRVAARGFADEARELYEEMQRELPFDPRAELQ